MRARMFSNKTNEYGYAVCIAKLAWLATVIIRTALMNLTWSTTVVYAPPDVEHQSLFA